MKMYSCRRGPQSSAKQIIFNLYASNNDDNEGGLKVFVPVEEKLNLNRFQLTTFKGDHIS